MIRRGRKLANGKTLPNLYRDAALEQYASALRATAFDTQQEFEVFTQKVFGKTGAKIGAACVKAKQSITKKATRDYGGDINAVSDVLRLKIECDSIEQIQLIQDALSDHQKERKKQQEIYWRQCELAVSRGVERPIPPTPTEPTIK